MDDFDNVNNFNEMDDFNEMAREAQHPESKIQDNELDVDTTDPYAERQPAITINVEDADRDEIHLVFGRLFSHTGTPYDVRRVGTHPDYEAIRAWIRYCHEEHPGCQRTLSEDLKCITVIDVYTRRLVKYRQDMEYAALSYVWGGYHQSPFNRHDELPSNLPKTIQDAIVVAREINIPYLWVDSLCIDQENKTAKLEQINIMDQIYEGAVLTFVALDGLDANSGLGRVTDDSPRRLQEYRYPNKWQSTHTRDPLLLSYCPSFNEQLDRSVWMTRGWTYQEAMLSSCYLFFTVDQVYFRCNELYCTEDVNDNINFRCFGITKLERPDHIRLAQEFKRLQNPLSDFIDGEDSHRTRLQVYMKLVEEYVVREVSYAIDALNAFSALLNRMQKNTLPDGFLMGLPLANFRWSLLWVEKKKWCGTKRRTRSGIPSWTWAGWQLADGIDFDATTNCLYESHGPPLKICKQGKEIPVDLRRDEIAYSDLAFAERPHQLFNSCREGDSYTREALSRPDCKRFDITEGSLLLVKGILFSRARQEERERASPHLIRGQPSPFSWNWSNWSHATYSHVCSDEDEYDLLLVDIKKRPRRIPDGDGYDVLDLEDFSTEDPYEEVIFSLVFLVWKGENVAKRGGVVFFGVPRNKIETFWHESKPRKEKFWWA